MSDAVMFLVLFALGPVVTALLEATKVLALLGWEVKLTSEVKFRVALIAAFVIGFVAALVGGAINLTGIVSAIVGLVRDFPGFWQLFPALAGIFKEVVTAGAVVYAISQAVYGLLEKKLKEASWWPSEETVQV